MNDWNELENRLRCWKPRRPSAKLEARLFPSLATATAGEAAATWPMPSMWHWLAPSMAAFVLAVFSLGKEPQYLSGFAGLNSTSLVATVAFDEPGLSTYSHTAHHSDANMLPANALKHAHSIMLATATGRTRTNTFK